MAELAEPGRARAPPRLLWGWAQAECCEPDRQGGVLHSRVLELRLRSGEGRRRGDPRGRSLSLRGRRDQRYRARVSGRGLLRAGTALTDEEAKVFGAALYDEGDQGELPDTATMASLGCGNPTAVAELGAGETVLDLGSGGGIDVLLSAKRVGPSGKAYGLDMTDEMLALARENQRKAGAENVEWLRGEIESIPLPGESVDVVISNCVINLSGDKSRVLAEAARVLRPGGRFAVSDVVADEDMDDATRADMAEWTGCIAGRLDPA